MEAPPVHFRWKEIMRIMNTQKAVTTVSQNRYGQVIISCRCSAPTPKVETIYRQLNYKTLPFTRRKFVVHKSEFEKMDLNHLQLFIT
jgi:23S rRNA C2498 (ribose-2'-O)-methylase RlmM